MSENFGYLDQIESCVDDVDNLKQFTIPKLKKASSDALTIVDTDSFDFRKDILEVIQQRFKLKESQHNFNFYDAYLVNNPTLLLEFDERRKMLKETCNLKDVKVNYTFLHLSSRTEAETICKEGLKIGNSKSMALGNPEMGVYVNRHPDILPPSLNKKSQSCFLLIFKHIIGKAKSMVENTTGDCLDPTPGFDCHMIKTTSNSADGYSSSQIFIYEYDSDLDVVERPRQLLPFALVSFKIKNMTRNQRSDARPNRTEIKFRNQKGKYDLKDRNNKEVPFNDMPPKNAGLYMKDNQSHHQHEVIDNQGIITEKGIYQRHKTAMNFDINKHHMHLLQELKSGTKALWSGELQAPNKAPMLLSAITSYLYAFPYHLYEEHIICCTAEDTIENIFQQFGLDRVPRIKLNTQTFWRGCFIDYIELIPSKHSLPYFLEMQHYMCNHNKGYTCVMEGGKVNLLILPCGDSIKRLGLEGTDGLYGIFMSTIPYSVNQDAKEEEDEAEEDIVSDAELQTHGDVNEDYSYPEDPTEISNNNTHNIYVEDKLERDYNYENENSNVSYTIKKYSTFEYNHSHRVEPQSNIIDSTNNDNYTMVQDDRYIESNNFIYNDLESHKVSTKKEAQISEENDAEVIDESSNKDNEDGIDDELADKIVLNCLKNSKGILNNPVINDNTPESSVEVQEIAPQPHDKESNIIDGVSNEAAYEDDDRRLLERILMQGDCLDVEHKALKNSKMFECGDGSDHYEAIASPPRSDPREERLLLKALNEDQSNRRKLVAKPIDVVLERQEDNPSRLFLYDNFTKGLYQNLMVTIGEKFIEKNNNYKKLVLFHINTDYLLSSIHECYKPKNNDVKNQTDSGSLKSEENMHTLNADYLLEALNNWHGASNCFRVVERVARSALLTSNDALNSGPKPDDKNFESYGVYNKSSGNKYVDYDLLLKRYKRKTDSNEGLPLVLKPYTNYRELNFCEGFENDMYKEVVPGFFNGKDYRPSVSFRQRYEEIMESYELKTTDDDAKVEGRNANPTNEWVVFDHNNKYTALFSAKKISNDDSKKPSNDEEDGGNDNDAVDYETSIDKFAWFLSDGAFKTTNKILKEKPQKQETAKDDCNLDFLFNLSQPSSFGSFSSIPFLEGSCDTKQAFNVLFDNINKGHKKGKKTRSSKPISTMKWPTSLTAVDINFPGSYRAIKDKEMNDLLDMDVDTNLDPRLDNQIGRDSMYWPIVNGASIEALNKDGVSVNISKGKYNSIVFKDDEKSEESLKSEIPLNNDDSKDLTTHNESIKEEVKRMIIDSVEKKSPDERMSNDEKNLKMETVSKMDFESFNIHLIIGSDNLKRWYASSNKVQNHEILMKMFDKIFELDTVEEKSVENVHDENNEFEKIITDHSAVYNEENCLDNYMEDEEMLYDPVTSCLNNDDNSLSDDDDGDEDEVISSANDEVKDDVRKDDTQSYIKNSLKLIDYSSSSSDEEDDETLTKKDEIAEFTAQVNKKRHAKSNYDIDSKKIKIDQSSNKNCLEKISHIAKVQLQKRSKLYACANCLQFYTKKYLKFHNSLRHPFKNSQHLFVHALFGLECLKKLLRFKEVDALFYWLKTSIDKKDYGDYVSKITSREFETIFKSCFPIACMEVLRKWSIRSKDVLQKFSYALAIAIHFQLTHMKSVNNFKNTKFDSVLNKLDKVLIQSSNNLIDASNDIIAKSESSRVLRMIPIFQRIENCLKETENGLPNGLFLSSNVKYLSDHLKKFQSKAFCRLKMSDRYKEILKKERLNELDTKCKKVNLGDKKDDTNSIIQNKNGNMTNPMTSKLWTQSLPSKTSTLASVSNDSSTKTANSQALKGFNSTNSNIVNPNQNKKINEIKVTTQVGNQMSKSTQKRAFMPSQLFPKQGKVKMTATGAKIFQPKSTSLYQNFKPSLFNQKQKTETIFKNPVISAKKVENDSQKNERNTINYKTIFQNETFFEDNKITSIEGQTNKETIESINRATTPTFDDITSQNNTENHNEALQAQNIGWNVQPCQFSQPPFQQYYPYQSYNIPYNTYPPQAFIPHQTPYPNASFYPQPQFNNPPSTYIVPNIQQVNMPLNTNVQSSFASDSIKSDAKPNPVETSHRRIFIFNKERSISKEIQDFLTSKGAFSFDPHNITLLRPLNNVQCFVLIYNEDLPVLNEIPNLIELKKDLRVKFLVYKDIMDVKSQRFEVVFGKGGQVYIEEDTLLNFCTDVLSKMLELINKQTATKPWKVVLSCSTLTTINDLMVSSSDDSTLEQHIKTLLGILEKFKSLIEYLPVNDKSFIQKPLFSQHYLHNLMSLQTKNSFKYRHFFLITERMPRDRSIREFRRNGVDVLSVSDFMKGFLSTIVPTNKIECGEPLEDVPSLYLDAKLSSACRTARDY